MSVYYVAGIPFSYSLCHHGIRGQRWGERNGPPYPLDPEDHSKTEQKAGWRKSLENERNYRGERKSAKKEAVKQYYKNIKNGKAEYLAKEDYKKMIKKIDNDLAERYPNEAKRREIAKKIAVGVGVAAIVGVSAYLVADAASYANAVSVQMDVTDKYFSGESRAASVISSLIDKDLTLSSLSDRDEVVVANTVLQRVIRDRNNIKEALDIEKARDFIYATFDKNDNAIYQTLFNARGEGGKLITNRVLTNDLIMPSARKRASVFINLLDNKEFLEAFKKDISPFADYGSVESLQYMAKRHPGQFYDYFNAIAASSDSKTPAMYFKEIANMGYNAIRDDNDSGYLGKQPIILLQASKDTIQTGYKKATAINQMIARFKLKNVPDFDRSSIFN